MPDERLFTDEKLEAAFNRVCAKPSRATSALDVILQSLNVSTAFCNWSGLSKFVKALSRERRYHACCEAPVSKQLFKRAIMALNDVMGEGGGYSAFIEIFIECRADGSSTCCELGFDHLNEVSYEEACALGGDSDWNHFSKFWGCRKIPDSKVLAMLAATIEALTGN